MFFSGIVAFGQQLPLYSKYLYNKILINPSVAGSDGYTSFSLTAREQWAGYAGTPRTVSAAWQTRILKQGYSIKQKSNNKRVFRPGTDGRVGLGGYFFSDRNGLINRNGAQFSYAYHTWVQENTQLSFGLAANAYHYRIDANKLNFEDPNDPILISSLRRGIFVPDAAFGISLLTPKLSLGVSADQLFQASGKIGGSDSYKGFSLIRQYFLFGSYDFSQGYYNIIQPSFLLLTSGQMMTQADIGLTFIYHDDFWTGLSYRTSKALIATVGMNHKNMFFGYAFDFTLQEIQRVTYGTHEISLAVKFGDSKRKYRWLDRY
jgi:type IX secretion system PorP/SprF family membrane protein